jgi:hypothetical protein
MITTYGREFIGISWRIRRIGRWYFCILILLAVLLLMMISTRNDTPVVNPRLFFNTAAQYNNTRNRNARNYHPPIPQAATTTITTFIAEFKTRLQEQQQQQQQQHSRSLWGLPYAVCPLSSDILDLEYNDRTGLYDFVTDTDDSTNMNTTDDKNKTPSGFTTTKRPKVSAQICWCTEYFRQPWQYCESQMDACTVTVDTVECFQSNASDSFVRSFWPVVVFWYIALLYAIICTDAGKQARRYMVVKITTILSCWCPTNRRSSSMQNHENNNYNNIDENNNTNVTSSLENTTTAPPPPETGTTEQPPETMLHASPYELQELDRLLHQEPEHAAYMYRSYVIRERRRQLAEQRRRRQQQQSRIHYSAVLQRIRRGRPIRSGTSSSEKRLQNTTMTQDATTIEMTTMTHHHETDLTMETTAAAHSTTTNSSSVVWDSTVIDPRLSDRLVLKTKIYRPIQENDNHNDDETGNHLSIPPSSSSSNHDTLPPPTPPTAASTSTPTDATTTPSSWSLPNLLFSRDHRDTTTLEEMDDEMEQGIRCAICLIRLEDGDIIGDISCGHTFHKDCLKDWLKRKNRCPLCQQTGIAKIYQEQEHRPDSHNHPSTRTTSVASSATT